MSGCACGCGEPVRPGKTFRHGHWAKANRHRIGDMKRTGRPSPHGDGYVTVVGGKQRELEHRTVAEKAIGRRLPPRAEVHHVNGDRADNRPGNLVICQDRGYHRLLHMRAEALATCGHAHWRKCYVCGAYDAPESLYFPPSGRGTIAHRACRSAQPQNAQLKRRAT